MAFNVEDVSLKETEDIKDVVLHIPKELFEKLGIRVIIEVPRRSRFFGGKRRAVKFAAGSFRRFKNVTKDYNNEPVRSNELDLEPTPKEIRTEYLRRNKEIEEEYQRKNDRVGEEYIKKIDELKDLVSDKETAPYNYDEEISRTVDELAKLHALLIEISYTVRKKQQSNAKAFKMRSSTLGNIRENGKRAAKGKQVSAEKFGELKAYLQTDEGKGPEAVDVVERYRDINNIKPSNDLIHDVNLTEKQTLVEGDVHNSSVAEEQASKKEAPVSLVDALRRVGQSVDESYMFENLATSTEEKTPVETPTDGNISEQQEAVDEVVMREEQPPKHFMFENLATNYEKTPEVSTETTDVSTVENSSEEVTNSDQHAAINTYANMAATPQVVEEPVAVDRSDDSNVMSILKSVMAEENEKKRIREEEEKRIAQERREALIQEYKEAMKLVEAVQGKLSAEGINPEGLVEGQVSQEGGISI